MPTKRKNLVADDSDGKFWEVESIKDERMLKGVQQFLIKWENYGEETWEPEENLCDSALTTAHALLHRKRLAKDDGPKKLDTTFSKKKEKDEEKKPCSKRKTNASRASGLKIEINKKEPRPPPAHHASLEWQEPTDHVKFKNIERIHVDDSDAAQRVTDARVNGTPVVLVGHKGWANFAKRWLNPRRIRTRENANKKKKLEFDRKPLDLAQPVELDVNKMKQDIGAELVPVVKYSYNQQNPIHDEITVAEFLDNHWGKEQRAQKKLYLHQWQFPIAKNDATIRKLCSEDSNHPLDSVLGVDLLKYRDHDLNDNPFQYLFMGDAKTRSKMHKDDGGLLITIAPIIGEKEVVLAHRSDGASCLHHLHANVNDIDIVKYPLMPWARLWKSIIKPGEILLMPHGTYHQCRNITPCLSYSRFYLDTVNLKPFYESCIHEDATEIYHDAVVWNACLGIQDEVIEYAKHVRQNKKSASANVAPFVIDRAVFTLSKLVLIAREFSLHCKEEEESKTSWKGMTADIEDTLHRLQLRPNPKVLPFQPLVDDNNNVVPNKRLSTKSPGNVSVSTLSAALKKVPKVSPLQEGDRVFFQYLERMLCGTILQIKPNVSAAFVRYSGLSEIEDAYVPFDNLKTPMPGESGARFCPANIKKDMSVIHYYGGEEYQASIQHWRTATTFCRVRIDLDGLKVPVERWLPRDMLRKQDFAAAMDDSSKFDSTEPLALDDETEAPGFGSPPAGAEGKAYFDVEEGEVQKRRSRRRHLNNVDGSDEDSKKMELLRSPINERFSRERNDKIYEKTGSPGLLRTDDV